MKGGIESGFNKQVPPKMENGCPAWTYSSPRWCLYVYFPSGDTGSDDGVYSELAFEIANGNFIIGDSRDFVSRLRIGLLDPVALGFKVTGPNEIAMIIYPFLVSILGIILAFFTGRAFFNDRVGLFAATLQSVLPFDARSASMLEPDLFRCLLG